MKIIQSLNNNRELNTIIHNEIMNRESNSSIPSYCSCIEEAWRVAEKVDLFESIIIVKQRNSGVWIAYKKGVEQPLLFGEEESREVDFLNMRPVALGLSFSETICRASILLNRESNERTERSNQQGFSLFEAADS